MTERKNGLRRKQRVIYRKTDPLEVYDKLPAPIRAALQEGVKPFNPFWARTQCRKHGVDFVLSEIRAGQLREIAEADDWQPPGHRRRPPGPSPHILAHATMQTSGRNEG